MKKICIIILVVITVFFSACANNKKEPFVVYEVGGADGITSNVNGEKVELRFEESKEIKLIKNKKFNIDGNEFEAKYEHTSKFELYDSEVDYYKYKGDDGNRITVAVNKNNDNVVLYNNFDKSYGNNKTLPIKSRDECVDFAKEFLSQYVSNIKKYELTKESIRKTEDYGDIYVLEFTKFIDGIRTCDDVQIEVMVCGRIKCFRLHGTGIMDDAEVPSDDVLKEIHAKVNDRMDEKYKSQRDLYSVTYNVEEEIFLRLHDGRYAMKYLVEAFWDTGEPDGMCSQQETFIVYLD